MSLTVYVDTMSQPSRALLMFLIHNKIPHKVQLTQIAKRKAHSDLGPRVHL